MVFKNFIVPMRDKPKIFSGDIPWTRIEDIQGRYLHGSTSGRYVSEDTVKSMNLKVIPKDSIIVSVSATFGVVAIVSNDLITNQTFIGLTPKPNYNIDFLYSFFKSSITRKKMRNESAGSTIFYITRKNIENMIGNFPSNEEQDKIGKFLKSLDTIIALHQRKINMLETLKKVYLSIIFPDRCETNPKMRFKNFNENWKEYKFFENINKIIDFRGRTPKKLEMKWSDKGYLALSALNVKNGFIDKNVDAKYGSEELYQRWMGGNYLKKGMVLFTTEAPMGNVALVPDNNGYILSQRTIAFDADKKMMTNLFLATILRTPLVINNLISISSGATAKGVSQKSLRALNLIVPTNLKEQERIGEFLTNIYDDIQIHQKQVNILNKLKSLYLHKMFL